MIFCSLFVKAQKEDEYIYSDSTVQEKTATVVESSSDTENYEYANEYVTDSVLLFRYVPYSIDSNRTLKASKQLKYIQNLDSSLIALKKSAEGKTNNTTKNESGGWLIDFLSSPITRYVFEGLAIVFICFILSKLFFTKGFFQRNTKRSAVNVEEDNIEDPSSLTDYDKHIQAAIKGQNYRFAVRYLYLRTLQKLTLAGQIEYSEDKTNYQYVRELTGKEYATKFAALTLSYEYVWYGKFDIDEKVFNGMYADFENFNTLVK